jgi:2-C-methyl-D-erythritol 2,4-cyclodiphosphate synthase
VLGGVSIPGSPGLSGHSDGDAITHAVIDALLGAGGLGNIGERFPDTDIEWKNADSLLLLEQTIRWVEERNYQVVNVDVTVVAEQPRITPHAEAMSHVLSRYLHIAPDAVCSIRLVTSTSSTPVCVQEADRRCKSCSMDCWERYPGSPSRSCISW